MITLLVLFIYSCLKVSSDCTKMEEELYNKGKNDFFEK